MSWISELRFVVAMLVWRAEGNSNWDYTSSHVINNLLANEDTPIIPKIKMPFFIFIQEVAQKQEHRQIVWLALLKIMDQDPL